MEPHPVCIYFSQKNSEYLTFIGHLIKIAAAGRTLGVDVMAVGPNLSDAAPRVLTHPGIHVEYSDKHFESMQV